MKKINLLLLSTLFLTGCNHEPLFFTGKVATNEEVLDFFSNVNEGYAFIPDGWYEIKGVYKDGNGKYARTSNFIVEIETYKDEQERWQYKFKQLQGVAFYQRNNYTQYYYATNGTLIIDTIYENGERETIGNKVEFCLDSSIFGFADKSLSWTFYLKDLSAHLICENHVSKFHIGIEYFEGYNKIVNGKIVSELYLTDGTHNNTITFKSCNQSNISLDIDYELGFETNYELGIQYPIFI